MTGVADLPDAPLGALEPGDPKDGSAPAPGPMEGGAPLTVGAAIEAIGVSRHHWGIIAMVWLAWIVSGWLATFVPVVLDAAGNPEGDWALRGAEVLTTRHKLVTLFLAGLVGMAGNLLIGHLSDRRGRVVASLCAAGVCSVVVYGVGMARHRLLLMALIIFSPFSRDGVPGVTQCLLAEWLPDGARGFFLVVLHALWSVGRLGLTLLWTACPPQQHWGSFCAAVGIAPTLLCGWLVLRGRSYESPRWLAVNGDFKQCMANLQLAAESSPCNKLPSAWDVDVHTLHSDAHPEGAKHSSSPGTFRQLMAPVLRTRVALLCLSIVGLFFGSSGYFMWSMEFFRRIGVDPQPMMVAAPLGKIACNVLLVVPGPGRCIVDRCPAAPLMRLGFLGCAACLALHCVPLSPAVLCAVVFLGQVFEEMVWTVGGIYMTEAFPTAIRSTAVGFLFTVGHVGSMLSSSFAGEMMDLSLYTPMAAMAAAHLLGLAAWLAMPRRAGDHHLAEEGGGG
eukprot:EG_transcript_7898